MARNRKKDTLWLDDEMSWRPTGLFAVIFALILLVAIIWGAGYIFFRTHFLPNTTVGGIEASFQSASGIQQQLNAIINKYDLTVLDRYDNEIYLDEEDISYGFKSVTKASQSEQIIKEQDALRWPLEFFEAHELPLDVTYDREAVRDKVKNYAEKFPEPQNAYINITDTDYELVPEVCSIDVDKTMAAVELALQTHVREMELPESCYIEPEILSTDERLVNVADQLDSYLSMTVTYDIPGENIVLSRPDIIKMLFIWEDMVLVNEDAVAEYVQQLAYRLNTYGDDRQFVTAAGDTITIGGGDYGWVVAKAKEKEQLVADLYARESITRPIVWEQTAWGPINADIGPTYLEVDYTNQHMYYFVDGVRVFDSDIISGNLNRNSGSPDGVFKIVYKQKNAVLVGEDYSSPVDYFLPFAYNVGFHDADWQRAFGGQLYLSRGSHGCINCPDATAQYLYENVAQGTPVVTYYRHAVSLTNDVARISNAYSYQRQ